MGEAEQGRDERANSAGTPTAGWRRAALVVGVIAIGVLAVGCGSTSSVTPTSDGVVYNDPGGAYAVDVDPDWKAGSLSQPKFWFTDEAFHSNVNAIVEDVPSSVSLADYLELSGKNAPNLIPGYKLLSLDVLNESGNRVLARWHYVGTPGGKLLEFLAITGLKYGRAVTLTYTTEPEAFADRVRDVEPYMRTLRI
jgi:hypothetical protein